MKRQNAELKKQNEDKDREMEQLKSALNYTGAAMVSALQEEIVALKEQNTDVCIFVTCLFIENFYVAFYFQRPNR